MQRFTVRAEVESQRATSAGVVRSAPTRPFAHRAFTLIEVLVSMVVIAILLAIMLPAISHVNETANRVVCRSNLRQLGMAVMMFADQNKGEMPRTMFVMSAVETPGLGRSSVIDRPQETMTLRVDDESTVTGSSWDGLGHLYAMGFLASPQVFYCPSHHGEFPLNRFLDSFADESAGMIIGNFQYRGQGPIAGRTDPAAPHTTNLFKIDPAQTSLIADGMRTEDDFNHRVGANFFRADQSVAWFGDKSRLQAAWTGTTLPGDRVNQAWSAFDQFVRPN